MPQKGQIIALAALCLLALAACALFMLKRGPQPVDFDAITRGGGARIASVLDDGDSPVDPRALRDAYASRQFMPYSGDIGNTARRTFRCFDADGQLLFELTDMGNRSIIRIRIGDAVSTYQFH